MRPQVSKKSTTTVDGTKIDKIFRDYFEGNFSVNRRYQRKLVWSEEQKIKLIDSIVHEIPIPLILLAKSDKFNGAFEIVDGLQRIDAIVSFIENRYPFEGRYFDLESWGYTKLLKDQGMLSQREPVMDQEMAVRITEYQIPISTYESSTSSAVDETFQRINSSGRKLGMQEVRQAGSLTKIAELVRKISAETRGDVSRTSIMPLSEMQENALTWKNDEDQRGLPVDEIYWIKENVLRRDDLRSSMDEQLILDILLDIILELKENSSSDIRNSAYEEDSTLNKRIEKELHKRSDLKNLEKDFASIFSLMSKIARYQDAKSNWTIHTGKKSNNSSSRYFEIAFLAFYKLLHEERLAPEDYEYIHSQTKDYWASYKIESGGTWTAADKRKAVNKFIGAIQGGFEKITTSSAEIARQDLERLKVDFKRYAHENRFFELKTGLLHYGSDGVTTKIQERRAFFEKIIKTASAMANTEPNSSGVIYIGVSDQESTTEHVCKHADTEPLKLGQSSDDIFHDILGVDHELERLGMNIDELMETLSKWIIESDKVEDKAWKKRLASSLRTILVRNAEGESRLIIALYPESSNSLVVYDGRYYERIGSSNSEVKEEPMLENNLWERYEQFNYRNL
ncbi:GmrSD restriction endonuclease domain-containing protein [Corynebacterium marquesiae]|uniref:GmrSD restriction endonuclease domain-containing protein n=1 Tax=Corynebacterium marquesiae TaxID=2913503 RepID=UPI0032ECE2FD